MRGPSNVLRVNGITLFDAILGFGRHFFFRFSSERPTIFIVQNISPKGIRIMIHPPCKASMDCLIFKVVFPNI